MNRSDAGDIIVKRIDGLYFGYHTSKIEKMYNSFIAPTLCITRIVSGKGTWRIGNEVLEVRENDFAFLNNIEYRTFLNGSIETENFWFSSGIFNGNDENVCAQIFYAIGMHNTHSVSSPKLTCAFSRITEELLGSQSPALLTALTLEFLFYAIREYEAIGKQPSSHPATNISTAETIAASIDYIHKHLSDDIHVADIATAVGMSREFFTRCFKKYVTVSPAEYIARCRVSQFISSYSKQSNITDLAFQCGFTSISGFYKTFTRICGTSPLAFLNKEHFEYTSKEHYQKQQKGK